ncbi:hypothetical protein NC77_22010 [Janthinobacterium lividum]|nr:hypothetical protein NC77_22010 [Janthinobacterium lividum]
MAKEFFEEYAATLSAGIASTIKVIATYFINPCLLMLITRRPHAYPSLFAYLLFYQYPTYV